MFSRRTIFVIGAGASYELGLPMGADLKTRIAELLNITFPDGHRQASGDYQISEILRRRAQDSGMRDWNYLLHKCWLIRDALPGSLSIDNLLDAHRNDPDIGFIGKLAITKAILRSERDSKLFVDYRSDEELDFGRAAGTWLVPLFQLLSEGVSKEEAKSIFSNVSFIIFNYDRCVERFLPAALQKYYGFSMNEAQEIVSTASIVHPYGRVGKPGADDPMYGVSFGSDRYELATIAEGIRTFCEGAEDKSNVAKALQSIGQADQVVFLGFAFHPLNMQLLQPEGNRMTRTTHIFATTHGLSKSAVAVVKSLLNVTFNKIGPPGASRDTMTFNEMNLENSTASNFLQEQFRSLASGTVGNA